MELMIWWIGVLFTVGVAGENGFFKKPKEDCSRFDHIGFCIFTIMFIAIFWPIPLGSWIAEMTKKETVEGEATTIEFKLDNTNETGE